MLIGVDARDLAPGHGGGEELYLRNVLKTIRTLQSAIRFLIITTPANHDSFDGWERLCIDEGAQTFRERLRRRKCPIAQPAQEAGVDALFMAVDRASSKGAAPLILYALELIRWEIAFKRMGWLQKTRLNRMAQTCLNAAAIIAPSEFIQHRLLRLFGVPLDKVTVAPLGVRDTFGQPQPCIVERPYLLFVGTTRPTKNIRRFRKALYRLRDEIAHTLVVVGRAGEAEPKEWGSRVVRIEQCPEAQLAGLYQHCDLFVCPSVYEGSGVTVLEAMRAGARVTAGRVGGIPEVAGDVPTYFNPESVDSMVGVIRRALNEKEDEREQRKRTAQNRAAQFTWEKCAERTLAARGVRV